MPLGIAAITVGVVFATDPDNRDSLLAPGMVISTLGAALIAGGIAMLVTGRTRVRLSPMAPRARAGVARPRQNTTTPVVFH